MGEHTLREVLKRRSEDTQRKIKRRRYWSDKKRRRGSRLVRFLLWVVLPLVLLLAGWSAWLDYQVRQQFEGHRWAVPARVYARPMELYPDRPVTAAQLVAELDRLGYRRVQNVSDPGTYADKGASVNLVTRPFHFWDGDQPALPVAVHFRGGRISSMSQLRTGSRLFLVRLDPPLIGSLFGSSGEDRILVRLDDVPDFLTGTLLAVEDRRFYEHHGVDSAAVARAMWADLTAGRVEQGGSTLTQQLVKNLMLNNERSFWRKFNEAIMSLSLELHYSKKDILQAYLNEVYLGQDGSRSIHGFGLGSFFYFQKPLRELKPHEMALLVALIKGPSYYDPRQHPGRALQRRNLVLDMAADQGVISVQEALAEKAQPLDVSNSSARGTSFYPAFMDLLRNQLSSEYHKADLSGAGLQIFTTLDPQVQSVLEHRLASGLHQLERYHGLPADSLEGAGVVTSVDGGEVLGIVGGRQARYAGFNRAIDSLRPIGSLVKPAVYLSALASGQHYTLTTPVEDTPLEVQMPDGSVWTPTNYDNAFHGVIPLYLALVHSYNVPTVRIGLDTGVSGVVSTLANLGFPRTAPAYPSTLLGAVNMSPFEVAQMYNTLANGGLYTRLNAIREVLSADGSPVKRYPLAVQQGTDPAATYLVDRVLQIAARSGTGSTVYRRLDPTLTVAGKTGTTDDLRDSWFAGFSGDKVATVWVGHDDNSPVGLTGASGAAHIWADVMADVAAKPFQLKQPDNVESVSVMPDSGKRTSQDCRSAIELPYVKGTAPSETVPCGASANAAP
ncbi:MAG: penicillin-binding protein 1B [Gammaproteobacteria bacterium]|jgi:penicillin-binding protein 1B